MKITVAGMGYVGLANGLMLSQHNAVMFYDNDCEKVESINSSRSPVRDPDIENFLARKSELNLTFGAVSETAKAFEDADYVIISTPTDYDPQRKFFDTTAVEEVIGEALRYVESPFIVIKSTVPIGYTARARQTFGTEDIIFSPEFFGASK